MPPKKKPYILKKSVAVNVSDPMASFHAKEDDKILADLMNESSANNSVHPWSTQDAMAIPNPTEPITVTVTTNCGSKLDRCLSGAMLSNKPIQLSGCWVGNYCDAHDTINRTYTIHVGRIKIQE